MFPYYFLRVSGPVLFVLVGLKILSGYALTGRTGSSAWLSRLHENRSLDFLLLFFFIFHALYGLRLFLIDLGMVKREGILLWLCTAVSLVLIALSYAFFF